MQEHQMTLTPVHTIRGGGIIQIYPTKPQILLLTILPKVIPILLVPNTETLLNINLHQPFYKNLI